LRAQPASAASPITTITAASGPERVMAQVYAMMGESPTTRVSA